MTIFVNRDEELDFLTRYIQSYPLPSSRLQHSRYVLVIVGAKDLVRLLC